MQEDDAAIFALFIVFAVGLLALIAIATIANSIKSIFLNIGVPAAIAGDLGALIFATIVLLSILAIVKVMFS